MELTNRGHACLERMFLAATMSVATAAALSARQPDSFGTVVSYYRVDASELSPYSTGIQYTSLLGLLRYTFNVGDYRFVAPLHLPSGASIVSVAMDFYDSSPTESVYAVLLQCDNAAGFCSPYITGDGCVDGGSTVCSGTSPAPGYGSAEGTFAGITVDNYAHQYVITAGNTAADGSVGISAFRVGYVLQVSPPPGAATFTDVPPDHPFFQFVEALAASGITGGCGGGKFCPDAPLTRGQMAVFLAKALGLQWQ